MADVVAGYGGSPVVHGVDLQVGRGELIAVVGPNGAGKSTLLKAITGELPTLAGCVELTGRDLGRLPANVRARAGLGYVPQIRDVFETLTVNENLEMGAYLTPKSEIPARREEVLAVFPELVPLLRRVAGRLSGGERKMVAVGRTLMSRPVVLILDEPSANLAPALVSRILEGQLQALAATGMGVLVVEQRALEALRAVHHAYVMVAGRVRMAGAAADLLAHPELRSIFLGAEV